jgi:transposase
LEEDNRCALLEGKVDAVIGVDTHRDAHAAAILDRNGGLVAQLEVPSSQDGYEMLLSLVAERAPGRRCWALEGTGCYGAGLASFLADQGEWVVEIDRPKRPRGRNGAKSDALDAIRAGREALSREQLASPRQRGHREALRVLQLARSGAVKVAAGTAGPPERRSRAYSLGQRVRWQRCSSWSGERSPASTSQRASAILAPT